MSSAAGGRSRRGNSVAGKRPWKARLWMVNTLGTRGAAKRR